MLKRAAHIITCFAVALLLLLNGTSHDFLHSFAGHEDTTGCHHDDHRNGFSFEQQHHHCDLLDLQSPVFLSASVVFFSCSAPGYEQQYLLQDLKTISRTSIAKTARGPPSTPLFIPA